MGNCKLKLFWLSFVLLFVNISSYCQDDEIQRFMDTLKMGGTYLVGKEFPAFSIHSSDNLEFTNKHFKGKITFINFWFEACAPCIAEMDALQNLYDKFKGDERFQFLSITYEKREAVESLKKKYKITYPVFLTSVDSCYILNFRKGFPTTAIVNKDEKISFFSFGGPSDPEKASLNFRTYLYPLLGCLLQCKD